MELVEGEFKLDKSLGMVREVREFFPNFRLGNRASFELSAKPVYLVQDILVPMYILRRALL